MCSRLLQEIMRYTPEHSEQTRARILDAAGRQFRSHGYGGVGVDGLAKAADVTSGAFYGHFRSKAEAFRAVATAGLERLRQGVERFRDQHGAGWLDAFARFYLGPDHRRDLAGGCALPSLSAEVGRADEATRVAYEAELVRIAELVTDGLPGAPGREAAWPVLALLAGGTVLSRAVRDGAMAQEIADAVLGAVQARGTRSRRESA